MRSIQKSGGQMNSLKMKAFPELTLCGLCRTHLACLPWAPCEIPGLHSLLWPSSPPEPSKLIWPSKLFDLQDLSGVPRLCRSTKPPKNYGPLDSLRPLKPIEAAQLEIKSSEVGIQWSFFGWNF